MYCILPSVILTAQGKIQHSLFSRIHTQIQMDLKSRRYCCNNDVTSPCNNAPVCASDSTNLSARRACFRTFFVMRVWIFEGFLFNPFKPRCRSWDDFRSSLWISLTCSRFLILFHTFPFILMLCCDILVLEPSLKLWQVPQYRVLILSACGVPEHRPLLWCQMFD